jgi:hypothetical protein
MIDWKCPRCMQVISADDTVQLADGGMSHVDCQRPRDLSPDERTLLFRYCREHAVAMCTACAANFRQEELGADLLAQRTNLCPHCRADLTESVRGHLYGCATLPEEVRQRAREVRDATGKLIKQSRQTADGLMREAETAITALREAMRRTT